MTGVPESITRLHWAIRLRGRRARELFPLVVNHHPRSVSGPQIPLTVYSVYRNGGAATLRNLLAQLPADLHVHLHALDATVPTLLPLTRSSGRGYRMPLLDQLITEHPPPPGSWVLITDDDVHFRTASEARLFVAIAAAARLDICQPAIDPRGAYSLPVTLTRPWSVARLTRFVEVGPMVLFSPRALVHVLPLPPDARMGWGVDVTWSVLAERQGLQLGVVDRTPLMHTGSVALAYPAEPERAALETALAAVGAESIFDVAVDAGPVWRPWRPRAPWTGTPSATP